MALLLLNKYSQQPGTSSVQVTSQNISRVFQVTCDASSAVFTPLDSKKERFFLTAVRGKTRRKGFFFSLACPTPIFLMSDLEIADKRVIRCCCKRASWLTGSPCSHSSVTLTKTNGTFHVSALAFYYSLSYLCNRYVTTKHRI